MKLRKLMTPKFQEEALDKAGKSPAAWWGIAQDLRQAAHLICWLDTDGEPIEDENKALRMAVALVYRMLFGLSIENLIKGLLVAQGVEIIENGKLKSNFKSHNLKALVDKLDTSSLNLTKEEYDVLDELAEYVRWRGKYPIPIESKDYILAEHGTEEHLVELELWQKLFDYLTDIGWYINRKGKKVPLK
jgi:hypothetical protein